MPITTPVQSAGVVTQMNPANIAGAAQSTAAQIGQPALVSDQLTGILNSGSPLMQQAATMGAQSAANKGLLNSSMGVQAAQNAMIQNAVPVASGNANAINQVNQVNAANQQQANLSNTAAQNRINQANAGYEQAANQSNAQQLTSMNQWNAGQTNAATLKAMDVNSREQLAGIEAQYKQSMQVNSSAESMYSQAMKNIGDIQMSPDVADKTTAINSQLAELRSGLSMIQNLNGISGLVTF